MTSNFNTFWPILKVLQILGLFPIKKSSENVCGFEALPTGIYLFLTLTVQSVGYACFLASFAYVMSKFNLDLLDLLHIMFALKGSILDDITYFGILILTFLSSLGITIGIFPLKGKMIELMQVFDNVNLDTTQESSWKNKSMLFLLIIAWAMYPIFLIIGLLMRLVHHINMDVYSAILFGALQFACLSISIVAPYYSFLIQLSEPCCYLNVWLKHLTKKVELKMGYDGQLIDECKKLLYVGLKNTNDAFSVLLFWITSTCLINMILIAYFALSFLFDSVGTGLPFIKLASLHGSVLCIVTLYFINVKSHEVTENLHELKDSISLSSDICFEDKCQLIEKMNSFNGFDANGYFTLGKQHLTSIVSNFATFIIVLIQFKMSEKTEA